MGSVLLKGKADEGPRALYLPGILGSFRRWLFMSQEEGLPQSPALLSC